MTVQEVWGKFRLVGSELRCRWACKKKKKNPSVGFFGCKLISGQQRERPPQRRRCWRHYSRRQHLRVDGVSNARGSRTKEGFFVVFFLCTQNSQKMWFILVILRYSRFVLLHSHMREWKIWKETSAANSEWFWFFPSSVPRAFWGPRINKPTGDQTLQKKQIGLN